jgi:hypothetical protein
MKDQDQQEDHGYIVFDSHSRLDADYTDASTVSSLSLSFMDEASDMCKRARFYSYQESCTPAEVSDDGCIRAVSATDKFRNALQTRPIGACGLLSKTASNNDLALPVKPSSKLQVPVPDPMIPLTHPSSYSNPQCALETSPSAGLKRKRDDTPTYSQNDVNLLLDSIEKAFVNNATKTMGVLEIMRRSGLREEHTGKMSWPMGYIFQKHQESDRFQEASFLQKTQARKNAKPTAVPNPLAAHEEVPFVIQVPCSPLGLPNEADQDNVSELGLDDQYQDLSNFVPLSKTDKKISNDVLDETISTPLPLPQSIPVAVLVPPSV